MNIDRLRPPKDCDLPYWLSCVVWDAIRDAKDAGMSGPNAHDLITVIARANDPMGRAMTSTAGARDPGTGKAFTLARAEFQMTRARELKAQAEATCARRTVERDRLVPDARLGSAIRQLAQQIDRLRLAPCPTMKFGTSATDVVEVVRSELDEVDNEPIGSDAAHRELGGLLASVLHLFKAHAAPLLEVVIDEEQRLRGRNDVVAAGGSWAKAKDGEL